MNGSISTISDASKDVSLIGGGVKSHQGRQFYVAFDPFDKKYKIKDLGRGYGAFAKLQGSMII